MATVVTKSFKIKTGENSFSDPINFLSTSVYLPSGKNLDTHLEDVKTAINTEIQNLKTADTALGGRIDDEIGDRQDAISGEQDARQKADTALGERIDALTGLINTEASTRKDADTAINDKIKSLEDNDISQIKTNILALQTTTNENKTNISSLEAFIKGENEIEENTPSLVDQVAANATKAQENYDAIEALKIPVNANTTKAQENYNAIEALKALVGAGSLEELEEGASSILNIINLLESRISVLEGLVLTAPDEPGEEGPVEPEIPEEGETEEPIE